MQKIYFNFELQSHTSEKAPQTNNTHYNEISRLHQKMEQKYAEVKRYLNAIKKSSAYIEDINNQKIDMLEVELGYGDQMEALKTNINEHIEKMMKAYVKSLSELSNLHESLIQAKAELWAKIDKEEDCYKWRLPECGRICDLCEQMMEIGNDLTI